jgi:uncharacterized protein
MKMSIITKELINKIISQYSLSLKGIHGISHWARVLENGHKLAELNNANLQIVELFAVFHDAKRINDGHDPGHGKRGAEFAATLRGKLFTLSDEDFELLHIACSYHTDGLTDGEITVQTCWDSDRLDLGRIGINPNPNYLCTDAAKNPHMINWANERSIKRVIPIFVHHEWGIIFL